MDYLQPFVPYLIYSKQEKIRGNKLHMEIIKVIGIGLLALIIIVILRQYKPEYAIYISLIAGVLILTFSLSQITDIVHLLKDMASKANMNSQFLGIILRITGIAILTEFAVSVCEDAGEKSIGHKIDLGGKMIIISLSLPIMTSLLETILKVLP